MQYKKLYKKLGMLNIILSHLMCIVTTYNYRGMMCGIEHKGFSGPAYLSLVCTLPFLLLIAICSIGRTLLRRKISSNK